MQPFRQYFKSKPIISQANLFIIESVYSFACWIGHWGGALKGTSFVPVFQELETWIWPPSEMIFGCICAP